MTNIEARVVGQLSGLLPGRGDIASTAKLIEDLGADSLAFEELGMLLEQEFAIPRITPEEQSSWVTVADVVATVTKASIT